jgi:hypothetical protein
VNKSPVHHLRKADVMNQSTRQRALVLAIILNLSCFAGLTAAGLAWAAESPGVVAVAAGGGAAGISCRILVSAWLFIFGKK